MNPTLISTVLAVSFLLPVAAWATPPSLMNTQGVLRTGAGTPVSDGTHALAFSVYAGATDPAPLWIESHAAVAVTGGLYSVVLGQATPLAPELFQNPELWLGVRIDGGAELPRARLLSVAYAFEANRALVATVAENVQCSGCIDKGALGFDLDATVQSGAAAACYDSLAELRGALDGIYASLGHTHDGFAPLVHAHGEYSLIGHAHEAYAPTAHTHSGADITSPVARAQSADDSDELGGFKPNASGVPVANTVPVTGSDGKIPLSLLPFSQGDLLAPADRALVQGLPAYATDYFRTDELGISGTGAANVKAGVKFGPGKELTGQMQVSPSAFSPYNAQTPVVKELCNPNNPYDEPTVRFIAPHDMLFAYWNDYDGGGARRVNVSDLSYEGETSLSGSGYAQGLNGDAGFHFCFTTNPAKAGQVVTHTLNPDDMQTCSLFLAQLFGRNARRVVHGNGAQAVVRKAIGSPPWGPENFEAWGSAGSASPLFDATDGSLTGPASVSSDGGSGARLMAELSVPDGDWDTLLIATAFGGNSNCSSGWCLAGLFIWNYDLQTFERIGEVGTRCGGWRVRPLLVTPALRERYLRGGKAYLGVDSGCDNGTVTLHDIILLQGHYSPQPAPYANDSCSPSGVLDLAPGIASVQASTANDGFHKAIDDVSSSSCGIHAGPDLVYSFNLERRSIVDVTVYSAFNAVTYLRGANCTGGADIACGDQLMTTRPLDPGTYHLFVDSATLEDNGPFTLLVRTTDAPLPPNDDCGTAQSLGTLSGSISVEGTTQFGLDQYSGSCGGTGASDVVYAFSSLSTVNLHVSVSAPFPAVLFLRTGNCASGVTLACTTNGTLDISGLAPGAYFLFVDGRSAADAGAFTLDVAAL